MQVKRYVAANMRLALKQVREEIGPDAVILSSKRLPDGVEIMAAVEAVASPGAQAANDNPFKSDSVGSGREPSRLERELEQWQRDNQQRARELANAVARQSGQAPDRARVPDGGARAAAQAYSSQQQQTEAAVAPSPEPAPDVVTLQPRQPAPQSAPMSASVVDKVPPAGKVPTAVEGEMNEMRRELQSMRDMLEQQLSSMAWGSYRQQNPQRAGLWRRLKRMGLSAAVSHELLDTLPAGSREDERNLWQQLMTRLARRIPVAGADLIAGGGVFALVGATGAGKTTTIGKLATRYVLEHGPDKVALVTTDTARIAAYEQLRTFGRILNVPVKVVDRHTSLEQVLYSLRHKSLVLVDTAGLTRTDQRLPQQLRALNEMGVRVKTILTIPATSQAAVIKAAYHTYKTDNLAGCILTKMDEATSIGEVLSLVVSKKLPLLYTGNGQGIPDDIAVADANSLIRAAIDLARPVRADDDGMAEEMATLAGC